MIVVCEECSKTFNRAPAQVKAHIFCSYACRYAWLSHNPMSIQTRAKIGAHIRGKSKTKEHRQKLSAALMGKKLSDEHRLKMVAGHRRGPDSPTWAGKSVTHSGAYKRCIQMFPLEPCEVCGMEPGGHKVHRHHKDGDPHHNTRDNIQFLCTKHHKAAHRLMTQGEQEKEVAI